MSAWRALAQIGAAGSDLALVFGLGSPHRK
jgi:hypothetical protein